MKKASEYREHAQACRLLARNAQNELHRAQLLDMAQTWETLATQRERLLIEQAFLDQITLSRKPIVPSSEVADSYP